MAKLYFLLIITIINFKYYAKTNILTFATKTLKKYLQIFFKYDIFLEYINFAELAERSKAAVLKTVVVKATWGSNP